MNTNLESEAFSIKDLRRSRYGKRDKKYSIGVGRLFQ